MKLKRIAATLLILVTGLLCACADTSGQLQIYDSSGALIAKLDHNTVDDAASYPLQYRAYLEFVLSDARTIVCQQQGCTRQEAAAWLVTNNCHIYTALEPQLLQALDQARETVNADDLRFAGVVTDLHGRVLAVSSAGTEDGNYVNYAGTPTPPYSSFKPLSVYAPAMAAGLIHYSTVYEDSPVKQLENEDGSLSDWPANATNTYRGEPVPLVLAVRESLNTVAVRCMEQLGLENSLEFLRSSFDLELPYEQQIMQEQGANEIYGNVALGYLNTGVSPMQMAGYYQIFGTGGVYAPPQTVMELRTDNQQVLYSYEPENRQVLEADKAAVMNLLLQQVVLPGGTGDAAGNCGTEVAGKTGTGDQGNWFVGVTPMYSCAIWHGDQVSSNCAAELFAAAVSGFPAPEQTAFELEDTLHQALFCGKSGLLYSDHCSDPTLGYYYGETLPEICTNTH